MLKTKGFTLIELMIVVAVIGILAGIAMAKYNNMIMKTREANLKSSLGSLRSVLSIYYADNEGVHPVGPAGDDQTTLVDALVTKYLKEIPQAYVYPHHDASSIVDNINTADIATVHPIDGGRWAYDSNSSDSNWGFIGIECYHADSKGTIWSGY